MRVFVLHGYWHTPDNDGVTIVSVSTYEDLLINRLKEIQKNKAADYIDIDPDNFSEDIWTTHYELFSNESYAKFYITEEEVLAS